MCANYDWCEYREAICKEGYKKSCVDELRADAVRYKEEAEQLEKRLKHLLQSGFIRRYDEKDQHTGKYVRDIGDADRHIDFVEKIMREGGGMEAVAEKREAAGRTVLYICDRRACDKCDCSECSHTNDIRHAKHFEMTEDGTMIERKSDYYFTD